MSLASRFVVTLVVSAVLPLLAYGWFSLHSMRAQIDEQIVRVFLPQLAADHAQQIETYLQRTDQACAIVREIARRVLDRDVASAEFAAELAAFDEQVELVPDLLDNYLDLLLLAGPGGEVVWWRDGQRLDPAVHGRRAALIPPTVAGEPWFQHVQKERGAWFLPWGRSPLLHRGLEHRSMDPASHHLGLAIDVPRGDGPPGVLFALLRWGEVQRILDQAREVLAARANLPSAAVFLVSRAGIVEAHTDRSWYGLPLQPRTLADEVTVATTMQRGAFDANDGSRWRVGFAPCGLGQARDFVVGVVVPESELFAATATFERVLLVAILVTLAVLVFWSLLASRAIVGPVRALVAATRRVATGDLAVSVPARGGPELGELAGAFNQMATELALGRERLVALKREEAWSEMARQVAHEVKNPLQPMRLAAQLLQRARSDRDPRAEMVADRLANTVLEQIENLDRIASDFRAFAGIAPAQRVPVRIDDWLAQQRDQCTGLFAGKPLRLELVTAAGDARVAIDGNAMARVLVNLLQNAIEAAPAGVHVRIASRTANDRVVVEIADDGPGVADAVLARLFEPYFTTKSSGTGLGLAICRRLVEAHGGTLRLVTSSSRGTTFAIELPIDQAERAGRRNTSSSE